MKKKDILIQKMYYMFFTYLSMHIYLIDIDKHTVGNKFLQSLFLETSSILNKIDIRLIIIAILTYKFYKSVFEKNLKINSFYLKMSIMFTIITIIGKCYSNLSSTITILWNSPIQLYKSTILIISYTIIYYAIIKKIASIKIDSIFIKKNHLQKLWEKYTIFATTVLIIIFWLPYIIVFYPGGATGDTADSVFQFFNSGYSWTVPTINLINPNIYINNLSFPDLQDPAHK